MPEKPALLASALILAVSVGLQLLPHDWQLLLRFERAGFASFELWRLLSGHLIHLSWNHLLLNAAGLILLAILFESAWQAKDVVFGGAFSALSISLGIYLWFPDVGWYVGLSGVLHAWFAIACIRLWPAQRGFASILLFALLTKLVFENIVTPATDTGWLGGEVIEQAHLLGASSGLLYALIYAAFSQHLAKYA
ncbi:MAG: rhombosortase [Pseudomonadales bacterium]